MHFDQRTQRALRDAGLSTSDIDAIAADIVAATQQAADDIETFFDSRDTVYSDMDRAHSSDDIHEHTVEYCDLFTHAEDIRGYLRFDTWGVPVEGGRVLDDGTVELRLGPTVDDRVRFATDAEAL